jgi:hypothetical protein
LQVAERKAQERRIPLPEGEGVVSLRETTGEGLETDEIYHHL